MMDVEKGKESEYLSRDGCGEREGDRVFVT